MGARAGTARDLAVKYHGDQKYGDAPYVKHLDDVAALVHTRSTDDEAEVIAYLHDILEDTDMTSEKLREHFSEAVVTQVELLTDCPGSTGRARKALTHAKLSLIASDWDTDDTGWLWRVLLVKAADRLANVTNCVMHKNAGLLRMYKGEHTEFRKAVFREKINESLFEEIDRLLGLP